MTPNLINRDDLTARYAHLPFQTALRYQHRLPVGLDLEDLIGAGWIGLLQAAELYDPARGAQFGTYAIALIRGAIRQALRSWDFVPRRVREQARHDGREVPAMLSLDAPASAQTQETLGERLSDPSPGLEVQAAEALERAALRQALALLPQREQQILLLRYGRDATYREIAARMGLTEQRVHQLHQAALLKLRRDERLERVMR